MTKLIQPEELILQNARLTLTAAAKNQEELGAFGISSSIIEEFSQKINQAAEIQKEEENLYHLKNATTIKNSTLTECATWGEALKLRVELAFGKKSPQSSVFTTSKFANAKKSEKQMLNTLPTLIKAADENYTVLSKFGLTTEMIESGKDLLNNLSNADADQEQSKVNRKSGSQARYTLFQDIYNTINTINKVGQRVFAGNNEKLVLFQSNWNKPTTPPPPPSA